MKTVVSPWSSLLVCVLILWTSLPVCARVIYVDDIATGTFNGSSWANAYRYLQDALADVNAAERPVEVRVAQGIYRPDQGAGMTRGDRQATFHLINGVTLKGGYAGLVGPDPNARNVELHITILSGDLKSDDVEVGDPHDLLVEPTRAENAYHVVTGSGTNETAVLDGFTITSGNANGPTDPASDEGLTHGAGMTNDKGSPTVTHCTFTRNSASYTGGAMGNVQGSNPVIDHCTFSRNWASDSGGAMVNGASNPTLTNCTFSGNSARRDAGAIRSFAGNPILTNCILWGDTPNELDPLASVSRWSVWPAYCNIRGGCPGEGNIDSDPRFADPSNGDYHLKSQTGRYDPAAQSWVQDDVTSPCIDAGDPNSPIGDEPFPNGGRINMGAYGGAAEASRSPFKEPLSTLAYPGPDGRLRYGPYANCGDTRKLNILPDWSGCGYMGGGVRIPDIPNMMTVVPVSGDNTSQIQAAIDYVSQLPYDANGFRGAVLLKSGTYHVEGTLNITASGVVLRGEGQRPDATVIVDTGQAADTLIAVKGGSRTEITSTRTRIIDSFVPVGVTRLRVSSAAGLSVGDRIIVHRQTNDKWIDDLNMRQYGWTASYYEDKWERVIVAIARNEITVDAPVVQAIEDRYGGGSIYKYTAGPRIRQVGIENLWLESEYDSPYDETHGWNGIGLANVENAWVRQVTSRYFGYSCVGARGGARNVTIQDCACLDPRSQITGGRRYSFNMDDCCFVLVQRCFAREGRHDYITGSRVPGPNAFVDCLAVNCHADSGNHHRYAEGTLFDNVKATNMAVENRESSGSGHGWSGAQTLFWNIEASTICHSPLGAMNWAIGIVGKQSLGNWAPKEPLGLWESLGAHVSPRSLYYKQLEDRLGPEAVANVTIRSQRTGTIWTQLGNWAGVGRMEGVPEIKAGEAPADGSRR